MQKLNSRMAQEDTSIKTESIIYAQKFPNSLQILNALLNYSSKMLYLLNDLRIHQI